MASVHQLLKRLDHVLPHAGVLMICFQGKEKGVRDGGEKSNKGIVLMDRKTGIVQRTNPERLRNLEDNRTRGPEDHRGQIVLESRKAEGENWQF
jgi:hypothetical protein